MGILDKIKTFVVKKYLLGYIAGAYKAVNGKKTQIVLVLAGLAWGAARLGYLTPEQENQLYTILGGAGSITFLSKLEKWKVMADEIGKEIQIEKTK